LPPDYRNFALTGISGLLLGALWMASLGYWYVSWQQPSVNFKQDKLINITVLQSIRIKSSDQCRVTARLHTRQLISTWLRPNVVLYWKAEPLCPQPGATGQVLARLNPVNSLRNPGVTDTARRRLSQKIVYTGQVKAVNYMAIAQQTLHHKVTSELMALSLPNQKWTLALLSGYRDLLEAPDWQLLQQTGTAHIFSISGMHLGIIALWAALVARVGCIPVMWLAGRTGRQPNLRPMVLLLTLVAAVAYTALANWQLPVTRALLLVILFMVSQQSRLQLSHSALCLIMLLVCLLVFPFSVFGSSLYLSLGAVCWLWLIHWWAAPELNSLRSKLIWMVKLQLALSLALVPATLGFFEMLPWLAPLFNLLILPVISLLMPLGLLAVLLYFGSAGLISRPLYWFDELLGQLIGLLHSLSDDVPDAAVATLNSGALMALLGAVTLMLCPPFVFRKWLAGILLMPLVFTPVSFNARHWYLHVVDVGQGSALLISRGSDAILIDTGPASPYGLSTFSRQVTPVMKYLNVRQLHEVFISHFDNDHAGGLADIEATREQWQFRPPIKNAQHQCQQGFIRHWQGLTIEALWPLPGNTVDDNNHSCVLRISDGVQSVLVAGDIERTAEYALLYTGLLTPVDILIAPHHGSATSSGQAFVNTVAPKHVVFTTARNNRWNFPAAAVIYRYRNQGSEMHNTAVSGYIRFTMNGDPELPITSAEKMLSRWYHSGSRRRVWPGL